MCVYDTQRDSLLPTRTVPQTGSLTMRYNPAQAMSPSTTQTYHRLPEIPTLVSPKEHHEMRKKSLVLLGYRDCSYEALRYMMEVEKMSEDDPLVLGLQHHLEQHQLEMDIQSLIDSEFDDLDDLDDIDDIEDLSPGSSSNDHTIGLPGLVPHHDPSCSSNNDILSMMTDTTTTATNVTFENVLTHNTDCINGNCCPVDSNSSRPPSDTDIANANSDPCTSSTDCEVSPCHIGRESLCNGRLHEFNTLHTNTLKVEDPAKWSQLNLSIARVTQELIVLLENETAFLEDDQYIEQDIVMNDDLEK